MCGRYYVDDDTAKEIEKLVVSLDKKAKEKKAKASGTSLTLASEGREVFPTNRAHMICAENGQEVIATEAIWGFPQWKGKGVIINCRAETAADKPTFRNCLQSGRCVIPAAGFFEWDQSKQKWFFRNEEERLLYMAGLYKRTEEENRFVILTTQANASMQEIHDRMPVVLREEELLTWLLQPQLYSNLLYRIPPMLQRSKSINL